jgi:hypothetical protein
VEFTPGIGGTKVLSPSLGQMGRFGNGKEKSPGRVTGGCALRRLSRQVVLGGAEHDGRVQTGHYSQGRANPPDGL